MGAALNNVTTANGYTDATTLVRPLVERVTLQVANAAIYLQLAEGWPGIRWRPEVFVAPGAFSFDRRCSGVRVRSAVAGKPGQVTADLVQAFELPEEARRAG